MNQKNRIERLEERHIARDPAPRISDEDWLAEIRRLSVLIAEEAGRQGLTVQDDPRLAFPLVVAGIVHERPQNTNSGT